MLEKNLSKLRCMASLQPSLRRSCSIVVGHTTMSRIGFGSCRRKPCSRNRSSESCDHSEIVGPSHGIAAAKHGGNSRCSGGMTFTTSQHWNCFKSHDEQFAWRPIRPWIGKSFMILSISALERASKIKLLVNDEVVVTGIDSSDDCKNQKHRLFSDRNHL